MFIGRKIELEILTELIQKKTSSLVVCKGRRRIGKSALITQYGQTQKRFLQFQGLSASVGQTKQHQLDNFAEQLAKQANLPGLTFKTWSEAFASLACVIRTLRAVVLIDEISWMGGSTTEIFLVD